MKKVMQVPFWLATMERKWLLPLVASTLISIALLLAATVSLGASSSSHGGSKSSVFQFLPLREEEEHVQFIEEVSEQELLVENLPPPPRFAYLISGTKGDGARMQRVVQALYHPRNHYLLHLDLEAPTQERIELARYVQSQPAFTEARNVYVVGKANLVTYRGPTMIAATLHGAAILLRQSENWDWFINLSASDYPLITQDGMTCCTSVLLPSVFFSPQPVSCSHQASGPLI
jgi:protein xylosyltransferase